MSRIAAAKPTLDVRDLQLVLALAESGSTVKAASTLHVTQSAVSRGLLLAEDKLGTRLFERTPRGLVPTPAGLRLIGGAGNVLAQLVELEQQARAPAAVHRLRLVCECYTAYRWLPSTLTRLRGIEVTLAFDHTYAPVPGLLAGEIDVALVTQSRVPASLGELPLFADEIVFAIATDHPLAEHAALTADDLRAYPLITSTSTSGGEQRWFTSRVFGKSPPRHRPLRFPLTEAIMDATRAGMGIAVVSEWIASGYLGGGSLVLKRLRGRPLRRPWRMAFRREVEDGAKQLAAALAGAAPRVYA